jgi:hypothetical protein
MPDDRENHCAEYDYRDADTPVEHHHVQVVGFGAQLTDASRHVDRPVRTGSGRNKEADYAQRQSSYHLDLTHRAAFTRMSVFLLPAFLTTQR